ncbi:MAG: alpha/beta hydrolase fold domain-containing protein [Planctomycetaceae bacterium]|nr:alpha/beta hydrolase fold domain-containing protein [Planctomycetaceae bacterium]
MTGRPFFRCCLLLPVILASISQCDAQIPADAIILSDIEYARVDGERLLLDVIRPAHSRRAPVVLFVHGGGWKNGDKKSGHKQAGWLVEHGFAVVTINYRLTDVAIWPAQIDDCYQAVRWIRRNADQHHFDADHIAAWGTSAGGHLAALLGTRRNPRAESVSSRVQAVCNWFGPTDLMTMPPNNVGDGRTAQDVARSNGAKLLGVTVREDPEKAHDASALHCATADASPFLIMHGSEDPGVPLDQSSRLHRQLRRQGVSSHLHVVTGAGHGGPKFQSPENREIVLAFLTRHLKNVWPQGSGPQGNFCVPAEFASRWEIDSTADVLWRRTLPETGQSTVVVWDDRLYFTTMMPVQQDAALGSDIECWCCSAATGETLWKHALRADHPLRLSGCFSDSSAPPPVTDGQYVCFFNASGSIACFNRHGEKIWTRDIMAVGRSQPFLHNGWVIFTRQNYMPVEGHFTHEHKSAPPELWTNLQALNLATGEEAWSSNCGVNMGCVPLPMKLSSGRPVTVVGRGGGHSPPEKPEGVSLVDLNDGSTVWTTALKGYMSTQTYAVHNNRVLVFHRDEHLWLDADTGAIQRRTSILKDVPVYDFHGGAPNIRTLPSGGKRNIIQQSNLLVGDYHYFRSYLQPYIGRVHVETGQVEYKHVPIQCRSEDATDALWTVDDLPTDFPQDKSERIFRTGTLISYVGYEPNRVRNSRGLMVMGDDRSQGNGWGHHAAAIPSAAASTVYMPIMSGMVYVHEATAEAFAQDGFRVNRLGPLNRAWTRSSLSFANNCAYARTISELICLRPQTDE